MQLLQLPRLLVAVETLPDLQPEQPQRPRGRSGPGAMRPDNDDRRSLPFCLRGVSPEHHLTLAQSVSGQVKPTVEGGAPATPSLIEAGISWGILTSDFATAGCGAGSQELALRLRHIFGPE